MSQNIAVVSRRGAMTQLASTIALASPIANRVVEAASPLDDPVLIAIERHKAAWEDYRSQVQLCDQIEQSLLSSLRQSGLDGDQDEVAVLDEDPRLQAALLACTTSGEAADEAAWELVYTEPIALSGVAALLRYAHEFVAQGAAWPDPDDQDLGVLEDWNSELHKMLAAALPRLANQQA